MKLEIRKKQNKSVIVQTRIDSEKAKEVKRIAEKNGFIISDVLRSSVDLFLAEYGDKSHLRSR